MNGPRLGFTLIEIIVVVIIMGILVALAVPSYIETREKSLDKEAVAALKLIRAANKQYFSKYDAYYPFSGSVSSLQYINGNLSIFISTTNWVYCLSGTGTTFSGRATRGTRYWYINDSIAIPVCYGAGCP